MTDELQQVRAMIDRQQQETAERKAQLDGMLGEMQADLVGDGADPITVRFYGTLAAERALLDAMDANGMRALKALEDGFGNLPG